jgi:hypothetical protein
MKKHSLRIFLMIGLFTILAASNAQAQTVVQEQTANIPFSFTVGDKTFVAGSYSIARVNPQYDPSALVIKSADGRSIKIILTISVLAAKAQENARLVFNRYDGQYFLAQVWTQADITGHELPRSRGERTLLAGVTRERTPERVAITLNARRK